MVVIPPDVVCSLCSLPWPNKHNLSKSTKPVQWITLIFCTQINQNMETNWILCKHNSILEHSVLGLCTKQELMTSCRCNTSFPSTSKLTPIWELSPLSSLPCQEHGYMIVAWACWSLTSGPGSVCWNVPPWGIQFPWWFKKPALDPSLKDLMHYMPLHT